MFDMFFHMIGVLLSFLKWPIIGALIFIGFFVAAVFFWVFLGFLKGRRMAPTHVKKLKKRNALAKIFYDAPKQYAEDLFNRPPDFFPVQGVIIFTGRQGRGKTSALMQYAMELHDQYPEAKCLSNTAYIYQDETLKHWKQLIKFKNGFKGVIVLMDELQNWFGSNQSRNFPPEMLSVITQNRKNRRVILGTSQSFHLLAKSVRSQCTEVRECNTLAGVLTIVIRREPFLNSEGDVIDLKYRGVYFFVHSKRLREAYDTWSTVEALSESGFQESPEHIRDNSTNITVINEVKTDKKK